MSDPIGIIVAFAGNAAPRGWLLCDGGLVPPDHQYDDLRKLIGKNTPDLQGQFLRGYDPKGKVDPDAGKDHGGNDLRPILSKQGDAVGPHTHQYDHWFAAGVGKSGADAPLVAGSRDTPQTGGPTPGATETRPKNIAVNFIIKAIAG